ncbi:hypothetical protein BH11PLA2_BH11PLA2_41500 [soil metagenome]
MKRLILTATLLLFSLAPSPAAEPALEIRIKAASEFVKHFEYFGTIAGQAEQAKQFADVVKTFAGDKGIIEGVDLNLPIGAYAVMTPGIVDSQLVVMLPVANEKAFLNLLTTRLSLNPEKRDDGSYFLQAPGVGPALYFRVHKGYACFTIQEPKNIEPEKLLDAKVFFAAKEDALISINMHIDRIPEELRKQFLGQLELALKDANAAANKGEDAAKRFGRWLVADGAPRAIKSLMSEGKTLSLKLFVEPKNDDLTLVASLTARDGSDLFKTLKSLPGKSARASKAAETKDAVVSFGLHAALPDAMKKDLAKHIDEAINEAVKNAKGDEKEYVEKLMNCLDATLKAGEYEFGAALTGTPGKLRAIAALKTVNGKDLEKLAKEVATFIPANEGGFEFDAIKLDSGNLHKITFPLPDLKRHFGSDAIWAKLGNDLYVVGLEPDGDETKRIATLKPGAADMLTATIAWTRFQTLVDKDTDPAIIKEVTKEVFGSSVASGADEIKLNISGGDQLTIKLNVKGKFLQLVTAVEKKKKG